MPFWASYPQRLGDWTHITTVDEFGAGHTDACGPAAHENLQAALEGRLPTYAHMDAIRSSDIGAGYFRPAGSANPGQTIGELNASLQGWHGLGHSVLYDFRAALYNDAAVRSACERISYGDATHPQGGLIVEVANAYALPFNEPGVNFHFVTVLGYDTLKDGRPWVLVGNGDRTPLPAGTGRPDWILLTQLTMAGVCGMIEVYLRTLPPPPPPPPPTPPIDATAIRADATTIGAAEADILSKLVGH